MISRKHANHIADAKIAQWEGLKEFDSDALIFLKSLSTPADIAALWADKKKQEVWLNADPSHESFYRDAMMNAALKILYQKRGSAKYVLIKERVRLYWIGLGPQQRRALLYAQIKADIDESTEVLANATAHIAANRAKYVSRFKKQMDALIHSRVSPAELIWCGLVLFGDDSEDDTALGNHDVANHN